MANKIAAPCEILNRRLSWTPPSGFIDFGHPCSVLGPNGVFHMNDISVSVGSCYMEMDPRSTLKMFKDVSITLDDVVLGFKIEFLTSNNSELQDGKFVLVDKTVQKTIQMNSTDDNLKDFLFLLLDALKFDPEGAPEPVKEIAKSLLN